MRIALINSYYEPDEIGGAEKSVRFLAESLSVDHEVMVLCCGKDAGKEAVNGVPVERVAGTNLYFPPATPRADKYRKLLWHTIDSFNPMAAATVRRVLKEFQPEVVHTNTLAGFSVSAWTAAQQLSVPVVHTLRDYYLLCPNTAMFKAGVSCPQTRCLSCRALSTPRIAATAKVAAVVGNSQFILDKHRAAGAFEGVPGHVIYNAYRPPRPVSPKSIAGKPEIVFGYIGRLAPTKGVQLLISSFLETRARFTELKLRLLIAGKGEDEYEAQLKDGLRGDTGVEFLGHVTPDAFYDQVDFPVVPSLWDEPLARVLFESFAHSLPVIASATGGSPELVHEGQTGWLFSPAHAGDLVSAITRALSSPQNYLQMSEAALERSKAFQPGRVVEKYLNIYSAVARLQRVVL